MPAELNWHELTPFIHFLVHTLHYIALAFMVVAYTIKIMSIMKKPAVKEGTPARGDHGKAIQYAFFLLARPGDMESTRNHRFRWVEFAVFHVAMAVGIGVAFTMPWAHEAMKNGFVIYSQQVIFGIAALIGIHVDTRKIRLSSCTYVVSHNNLARTMY